MHALRVFAARSLCGLILCLPAIPQQTPPAQPVPQPAPQPAAQQPAAPQPDSSRAQFRSDVTDVIVPVTVTDDKGRFVSNLTKNDFRDP